MKIVISVSRFKRISIYFLYVILFVINIARCGFQMGLPSELLVLIAILIISFGNIDDLVAVCFCCIPLYTSFQYLYVLLYAGIVLIIKKLRSIKFDYTLIVVVFLFIWEILHFYLPQYNLMGIPALVVPFIFVFLIYSYNCELLDYSFVSRIFAVFVFGSGLALIIRAINIYGGNIIYAMSNLGRLGIVDEDSEIIAGMINPNSYGIMCVLAISVLLQNYLYCSKKKRDLLVCFGLLILGLFTLSKTFVVCLLTMAMMFVCEGRSGWQNRIKYIVTILIMLTLAIITLNYMAQPVLESLIDRWQQSDLSTGRGEILAWSIECLANNNGILLFGIGLESFSERILEFTLHAPHDSITEIIMAWGVLGGALFITFLVSLVKKAKRNNIHIGMANYIPFVIIIVKALLGHMITSDYTIIALALAYLSLCQSFRQNIYSEDTKQTFITCGNNSNKTENENIKI